MSICLVVCKCDSVILEGSITFIGNEMNALARFANDWSQISFVGQGSETQLQVGDFFFLIYRFSIKG